MWKFETLYFVCLLCFVSNISPQGSQGYASSEEENYKVYPVWRQIEGQGLVAKCRWGYRLTDDNTCEDIDECAEHSSLCGPTQLCSNVIGGYTCSCRPGLQYVSSHHCEDIDECANPGDESKCSLNADCVNTVGSYQCQCHEGFRSNPDNDKVCWDIDECDVVKSKAPCLSRCLNVPGSYRCSCPSGYRLSRDKRGCIDSDECALGTHNCARAGPDYQCVNIPGFFRCVRKRTSTTSTSTTPAQRVYAYEYYDSEEQTGDDNQTAPVTNKLEEPVSVSTTTTISVEEDSPRSIADTTAGRDRFRPKDSGECALGTHNCARAGPDYQCVNIPGSFQCVRKRTSTTSTSTTPAQPAYAYEYYDSEEETGDDNKTAPVTNKLEEPVSVSTTTTISFEVKLFTMRGPTWQNARMKLINVDAPPSVKNKAGVHYFNLTQVNNEAVVSLVRPLEGPQSIELQLVMERFSAEQFGGIAVAKLFIFVSEYEF